MALAGTEIQICSLKIILLNNEIKPEPEATSGFPLKPVANLNHICRRSSKENVKRFHPLPACQKQEVVLSLKSLQGKTARPDDAMKGRQSAVMMA